MSVIIEKFWESLKQKKPVTQLERYQQNHASEGIQRFIALGGGPRMGNAMENFARFKFTILQKREKGNNTGYDQKFKVGERTIFVEQKSSGYWKTGEFKWQHIEPNHKWDILLLCGIEYNDIRFWGMNRSMFNKLISENKITNQGNKQKESSEGMWCNLSAIKNDLIAIESNEDLLRLVE